MNIVDKVLEDVTVLDNNEVVVNSETFNPTTLTNDEKKMILARKKEDSFRDDINNYHTREDGKEVFIHPITKEETVISKNNVFDFKYRKVARLMYSAEMPDKEIAEYMGLSRRTMIRWKERPEFQQFMSKLNGAVESGIRVRMNSLADIAVDTLEELLLDNTISEHARLNAAKLVLSYTYPQEEGNMTQIQVNNIHNSSEVRETLRTTLAKNNDAQEAVKALLKGRNLVTLNKVKPVDVTHNKDED